MTGWLIYGKKEAEKNKWFISELLKYAKEKDILLEMVYAEEIQAGINGKRVVFVNGEERKFPDFALNRSIFPFLSKFLENAGVKVYNSSFVAEICNDKRKTHEFLSDKEIPMMETYFFDRRFFDFEKSLPLSFPMIVKPSNGHGGEGIVLAENKDSLKEAVLSYKTDEFLIQKPCSDVGKDMRVYIMGKTVLAAMLRISETDFRSNFSLGGRAERKFLSRDEEELVLKVADLFNFTYAGIDFIFDNGKMVLNEIEDVVGARMLYEYTDLEPHKLLIDFIKEERNGI